MKNLVFFDIDGTLATGKNVPESAEKALELLRAGGNLVFICTGRNPEYVKTNFGKYADGFICSNGRYAFMGERVLYSAPLSKEQVRDLADRIDSVNGGCLFFGLEEGFYCGNPDGFETMVRVQNTGSVKNGFDPDMLVYTFDAYLGTPDRIHIIQKALDPVALANPHGPHPSTDITVYGVDKGTALRHVAQELDVSMDHTYAFGDGKNDICMLEAAGHGVAMGNALPEVKAIAEHVTTPINEDGVYNGLKHYGLI